MSQDIIKKKEDKKLQKELFIKSELEKHGLDLNVRDRFVNRDGRFYEIGKIKIVKEEIWCDEDGKSLDKPYKEDTVIIEYGYFEKDEETQKERFSKSSECNLKRFKAEYIKITKPIKELIEWAMSTALTEEEETKSLESQETTYDTSLVHVASKENLIAMKKDMDKKREIAELKMRMIRRVLENKRNELQAIVSDFEKKVEKLQKIIYTIELYLGIKEQVVELQDGTRASEKEPICFRQEILFMDEEVGDPTDDGIDFKNIEEFDSWLIKNKNYDKILPEKKCIVIFRVRRKNKMYDPNPFVNGELNIDNKKTYILIRNGERICRIWANINIYPSLFPGRTELQELMEKLQNEKINGEWVSSYDKEKAEKSIFKYRRQMIMLQGIIDRTDLFHPLPAPEVRLSDPEAGEKGYVKFIYDDMIKLPDGKLSYKQWQEKANETIQEGSRIIISGSFGDRLTSKRDFNDRFLMNFNKVNTPNLPSAGIYQVEKHVRIDKEYDVVTVTKEEYKKIKHRKDKDFHVRSKYYSGDVGIIYFDENGKYKTKETKEEFLIIKYNPKDTVYGSWGEWDPHERKNKVSFIIDPQDSFLINYDTVTLEEVDFYLNSRVDRKEYLSMMPTLYELKKARLAEIEFEKDFIKMMQGQLWKQAEKKNISIEKLEEIIKQNIVWWKLKNKWKRGINKDDAKALRMIKSRIEKQLN